MGVNEKAEERLREESQFLVLYRKGSCGIVEMTVSLVKNVKNEIFKVVVADMLLMSIMEL